MVFEHNSQFSWLKSMFFPFFWEKETRQGVKSKTCQSMSRTQVSPGKQQLNGYRNLDRVVRVVECMTSIWTQKTLYFSYMRKVQPKKQLTNECILDEVNNFITTL